MQPMLFDRLPERTAPRSPERARLERREAHLQRLMRPGGDLAGVADDLFRFGGEVSPISQWFNDPDFARWFRALRRAKLVTKVHRHVYCGIHWPTWVATRGS